MLRHELPSRFLYLLGCGRLLNTVIFACTVCFGIGLLSGHPRIFSWKPILMPVLGVSANIGVKLSATASLGRRDIGDSLLSLLTAIAATQRASQAFVGFGCWSSTGATFFFDVGLYGCLQGVNLIWNRVRPFQLNFKRAAHLIAYRIHVFYMLARGCQGPWSH
eukprot:jgi/Botrbrau1/5905/Bobra.0366s0083.2